MADFGLKPTFRELRQVPRETQITRDRFEAEYFSRRMPVVMCGEIARWPALAEWSPEWLKATYGDAKVHASLDIPERGKDFSYWGSDVRWMPLAEFVDHMMTSERPCYMRQNRSASFPDFDKYFDFESLLCMDGRSAQYGLWFGSKGTDSGVHWDVESNFLAQIYGHKKAILFAPHDAKYLYPYRDQIRWTSFSAFAPDFERFPRASKAIPYLADLGPGDVIHIPRGWWHQVVSLDVAISINCFFQPSCDLGHFMRSIVYGGPWHVARTARDFVMLGLFRTQQGVRTVSDVPTGLFLYNIVHDFIARRFQKG